MKMPDHFVAAIFDVDDTLLDNHPEPGIGLGLHEQSRLRAVHEVGRKHHLPSLEAITREQNYAAFKDSPVHSLDGAVWGVLQTAGLVGPNDPIDRTNQLFEEIFRLKNELHIDVLKEEAKPVSGALEFIRLLENSGLRDKLAVASTAEPRDVSAFFDMYGLHDSFPKERVISKHQSTHPKPHPASFEQAFQTLHLPESEKPYVLAVEDDPRGIKSAKAAGLFTAAIATRYSCGDLEALDVAPDVVATSYHDLTRQLAKPIAGTKRLTA